MPIPAGPPTGVVTLEGVKDHLNIDATDDENDVELAFFLTVANDWVATKVSDLTPTPVRMAILEVVRHMWDTQRGSGGGRAVPGAETENVEDGDPLGYFLIPRVRELLDPYIVRPAPLSSFPPARAWPDMIEFDPTG